MAGEVGDEGAERKHSKKKENSWWQNCWVKLFLRFPRISAQSPRMVEAEAARDERDCSDEKNPVDVGHIVHDGLLQVADVVLALVAQPVFLERVPSLDGPVEIPVLFNGVEAELKEGGGEDEGVDSPVCKRGRRASSYK